jgi:hypothetical protein
MKNPFKQKFELAEDFAKMLWTDKDVALFCSISLAVGYVIGFLASWK